MLAIWSLVPLPFLKPAWNLLSHQESPYRPLNIINVTPAFRGYSKFSWKMFRPQRAKEEGSLKKKKKKSAVFSSPVCNNSAFEIDKMEKKKITPRFICQLLFKCEGSAESMHFAILVHMLFWIYWPSQNFDEKFLISYTFQMLYIYSAYGLQNIETDYQGSCEFSTLEEI